MSSSTLRAVNASDEQYEWVSVAEASRRLKLSPSEVRRRVKAGLLEGMRQPRGPGDTRDRFMVQVPVRADGAPSDAQPHADSETLLHTLDALARAQEAIADLRERAGRAEAERDSALVERDRARDFQQRSLATSHEYFERWMELVKDGAVERQRTNDALARVKELNDELGHLRVDLRRAERQEEQAKRVADAQLERADALAEQLAAAEQRATDAEARAAELARRRWRWKFWE